MPFLIGLLGLIAVAYLWMSRVRHAAEMTNELANMAGDVLAAARRLGFRRRTNIHPVESIEDTVIGIGALAQAFIELGGLPTEEQQNRLITSLQAHTGKSLQEAEETLILGRWIIAQCNGPEPAIDRLLRRLVRLDRTGSFEPLMAVLNDVAKAGRTGEISDKQMDALTEIARQYKVR
ncbi:MAG: hypothetical protein KDE08_08500 [Rhodobacteraceae bacterium]|nr:hypothetical protein [Paracoccaceae bacterium]